MTANPALKIGLSKADITPRTGIRLNGSMQRRIANRIEDRIEARAMVLEQGEKRFAIVCADIIGFEGKMAKRLEKAARKKLSIAHVLFNASHTHSSPDCGKPIVSEAWSREDRRTSLVYFRKLEILLLDLLERAGRRLVPATVERGENTCDFGVNRRLKVDGSFHMRPNPDGYRDNRVTVLRFLSASGRSPGRLLSIVFSYACHPTTWYDDFISGDFPAEARRKLEHRWRVPALYLQGACGEIRPGVTKCVPGKGLFFRQTDRRDITKSGTQLARAVSRSLRSKMQPLSIALDAMETEIDLPLSRPPRATLAKRMAESDPDVFKRLWWSHLQRHPSPRSLEFRSLLLKFSDDFWILGTQHELCAGYVPLAEELAGNRHLLLLGYSNGFAGYIPTLQILREGGYEGKDSAVPFGLPGPFTAAVEKRVLRSWSRLFRLVASRS